MPKTKTTAEERKAGRTGRYVGRIREMIAKDPGEKVDAAVLRHRAAQMETDYGDDCLHDALDTVEREIVQHNKAVLRDSDAPAAGEERPSSSSQGYKGRDDDDGYMQRA